MKVKPPALEQCVIKTIGFGKKIRIEEVVEIGVKQATCAQDPLGIKVITKQPIHIQLLSAYGKL